MKPVADFPEPITLAIIETGSKLAVMSRAVDMLVRRIFDRLQMGTRKLAGRAAHGDQRAVRRLTRKSRGVAIKTHEHRRAQERLVQLVAEQGLEIAEERQR